MTSHFKIISIKFLVIMGTSNILFDYLETEVGILARFRVNVLVKETRMELQETQGKL